MGAFSSSRSANALAESLKAKGYASYLAPSAGSAESRWRVRVGPLAWALPFVVFGLPAFLMGGTLPALMRALRPDDASIGRASALGRSLRITIPTTSPYSLKRPPPECPVFTNVD